MTLTTSYQAWYVGQTFPSWDIPLNTDAGPDDLTGVNISTLVLIFHPFSGTDRPGTGTFTIKSVYPAEVLYKPSVADVANAFNGSLIVTALYPPSGTAADEVVFDPIPMTITAI